MENKFEHILKHKLQDFSVAPEPDDWTRIERSLGLEKPRRVPLYRYVAAAAAVLVLMLGGFFLFDIREMAEDVQVVLSGNAPENQAPPVDSLPVNPEVTAPSEAVKTAIRIKQTIDLSNGIHRPSLQQDQVAFNTPTEPLTDRFTLPDNPSQTATAPDTTVPADDESRLPTTGTAHVSVANPARPAVGNSRARRSGRNRTSNNPNWGLSLFADGSGGGSSNNGFNVTGYNDMASMDAPLNIASSSVLVRQEYDSYGSTLTSFEASQWNHNLPLSFGLSLRKSLTDRWGVEIGVSYSYLSSKAEITGEKVRQQLHYLGVPLGITYTPVRSRNMEFYGRLGGSIDFNIAGRQRSEYPNAATKTTRFTQHGIQWSVSANLGVMYNLSDRVGFYLEPGVGHYFESSSQPHSYWKEHPTNFNLKVGVRTNF